MSQSRLPPGMKEAAPTRQQQDIPEFYVGQRVEGQITSMIPSEYTDQKGKRDQIQFDVKLIPSGYEARAWISYYPVPNPKQHIGKLYIAIQEATGKVYQDVDKAMAALREYGRIFLEVTGFNPSRTGDIMYPKFGVVPNQLPKTESQQSQPQPVLPTQKPTVSLPTIADEQPTTPHGKMVAWIRRHPELVGNFIPIETVYNMELAQDPDVIPELVKEGLAYNKAPAPNQEPLPFLDEKARTYLG